MDSLHQRLLKAFDYLKDNGKIHTRAQFAETIGKSEAQISLAFKDIPKRCTSGLMAAIANAFPDVLNRDYLLTGEGEVAAPDRSLRPHVDTKASAGFMSGMSDAEESPEMRKIDIPGIGYDFSIDADGDSMLPKIESGDTLLCRRSRDRANPPIGKICVIDSKDGAAVKVIAGVDDEFLTLHSLNPDYPDYNIALADINGIAEVLCSLRVY